MDFGLTAFGSVLGERVPVADVVREYTDDIARILDHGYRYIHRSADGTGLTDLAEEAARRALRESGLGADEVSLLVLAITDIPEYLYWDAAAAVAHRIGAGNAEAVLIGQGCVGSITCLDLVAGRFATHPGYRHVLVVGANRTCETYWNRMDTHSLLFSDGAVAAVATRGHDRLRWRATEVVTDGRYADFFRMDGGAASPFTGGEPPAVRDAWDMMEFFDYDPDRFGEFIELMNERVHAVTLRACSRIGADVPAIERLVLFNDNMRTFGAIAKDFGMAPDRTNRDFSLEHGHFGAADHLLALQHHEAAGDLKPGDLVALSGMGRGMHWACTLIEV